MTPSDGFTQISINFANQVSSEKNRLQLAGHTHCARQSEHRKQYGVLKREGLGPKDT